MMHGLANPKFEKFIFFCVIERRISVPFVTVLHTDLTVVATPYILATLSSKIHQYIQLSTRSAVTNDKLDVHVFLCKLHNDKLNDLYCAPNIVRMIKSRRMRWARHVAGMGEMRVVYRVLVGKPERKRPFARPRHG
jgi:hypothetical protein